MAETTQVGKVRSIHDIVSGEYDTIMDGVRGIAGGELALKNHDRQTIIHVDPVYGTTLYYNGFLWGNEHDNTMEGLALRQGRVFGDIALTLAKARGSKGYTIRSHNGTRTYDMTTIPDGAALDQGGKREASLLVTDPTGHWVDNDPTFQLEFANTVCSAFRRFLDKASAGMPEVIAESRRDALGAIRALSI